MEVDHAVFTCCGVVVLERTHATNAAHKWINNHLCERSRNGCVKGSSALVQDRSTNIGGAGLWTNYQTFQNNPRLSLLMFLLAKHDCK